MRLQVQAEFEQLAGALDDLARKQLPYATRRALTDTVRIATAEIRKRLPQLFDRPVPFTSGAFYAKPAYSSTGSSLEAFVGIKDFAPKGTPASKYLAPEIDGGPRRIKRFERRLDVAIGLPNMATIPGTGALLDAFGNMQRKQIGDLLSHLRAFSDTGQNVGPAKLRRLEKRGLLTGTQGQRAKYFVAKSKQDGTPLGVWNVLGGGIVVPVLIFAKRQPTYSARLPFYAIAQEAYAAHLKERLTARLTEAILTAKPGK